VPLSHVELSSSLQTIEFTAHFNLPIVPGVFDTLCHLKDIKFERYNQRIQPDVFPDGLTTLDMSSAFNNGNEPLEPVFPKSLLHLHLGAYNQPLRIGIVPHLNTLHMDGFNQDLVPGVFNGVKDIKLGHYNKPIPPGVFTEGLTKLEFGMTFYNGNKPLQPVFPSTLIKLDLGAYDLPLHKGVLPMHLNTLTLMSFNHELQPGVLPSSLFSLHLYRYNHVLQPGVLPHGVRVLMMNKYSHPLKPGDLPDGLLYLSLYDYNHALKRGDLPHSVWNLTLEGHFNQSIPPGVLHEGLLSLTLGREFTKPISEKGILPTSLEKLEFNNDHYSDLHVEAIPNDTLRILLPLAPDRHRLAHDIQRQQRADVAATDKLPAKQTWGEFFNSFIPDDFETASGGLHGWHGKKHYRTRNALQNRHYRSRNAQKRHYRSCKAQKRHYRSRNAQKRHYSSRKAQKRHRRVTLI
jgi:NADH:ubiquinone oxidoreductase subunit